MNTTIQLGLALLDGQKMSDFVRCLSDIKTSLDKHSIDAPRVIITDRDIATINAVDAVFPTVPHIICRWHFKKDVLAHARKRGHEWGMKAAPTQDDPSLKIDSEKTLEFWQLFWNAITSATEQGFNTIRDQIDEEFNEMSPYLHREWWPYRGRLCDYSINKIRHFGEVRVLTNIPFRFVRLSLTPAKITTSRNEGSHAGLKSWLVEGNKGDIYTFFRSCLLWWDELHARYHRMHETERLQAKTKLQGAFWSSLVRRISSYALLEVKEHVDAARQAMKDGKHPPACSHYQTTVFGWPCVHRILDVIQTTGVLLPSEFDKLWFLNRSQAHSGTLPLREFSKRAAFQKIDRTKPARARASQKSTHRISLAAEDVIGDRDHKHQLAQPSQRTSSSSQAMALPPPLPLPQPCSRLSTLDASINPRVSACSAEQIDSYIVRIEDQQHHQAQQQEAHRLYRQQQQSAAEQDYQFWQQNSLSLPASMATLPSAPSGASFYFSSPPLQSFPQTFEQRRYHTPALQAYLPLDEVSRAYTPGRSYSYAGERRD